MHSSENPMIGGIEKKKPASLQELIGETPDAIVVVSGASKFNPKKGRYEMGSYSDTDDSGLVTGGKDRDIAAAELSQAFPESTLVTTSQNMNPDIPTYASIQKGELVHMGIPAEKIIEENVSYRTVDGLKNTLLMAKEKGWKRLVYITSPYHIARMQEFLGRILQFAADDQESIRLQAIHDDISGGKLIVKLLSSDEVLPFRSKHYTAYFDKVKQLPSYAARLAAEQKGVEDIRSGKYKYTGKQ
jgi:hypothetical protein